MEQMNEGSIEEEITTYDVCVLCDYKPPATQDFMRDVCTCCDAGDWAKKDA